MAQASISIANGSGASVRSAINSALEAITTLQSGATAPSTTYPFMQWADTANDLLKQRNAANSAWITKGTLSAAYGGLPASSITYDPGSPGLLAATDVQAAIDELAGNSPKFIQIVNTETGAAATGTTQIPLDDTIPQNTEGDQYMSLSITPNDANNILYIDVVFIAAMSASTAMAVALFQDSTANALAVAYDDISTADRMATITFRHKMVAGTTSATTFKVRAGPSGTAATMTFNGRASARLYGGVMASSITITEVKP